ncbi:MAG: alpha/beta hydrolase [Gemmatimonadetes bacterium]|nr:alpha/beta hydrolase [Gemmatimonadota bacterium]
MRTRCVPASAAVGVLFAISGCHASPAGSPAIPGATQQIQVFSDVPYRSGESKAFRLDLALPPRTSSGLRPAIVIVHGGGWAAGSKTDAVYQGLLLDYARQGYVTTSVEYRLTREAPFPTAVADVKCAVKWVRAHARELGVDPDRIGAYGHSAGAHLVMMAALVPESAGLDGEDCDWQGVSGNVNVVAAGSTPTEGGARQPAERQKPEFWPIGYITRDAPPMLLLQGTADPIVRVELVDAFIEKMKAAGARDVNYVRVEGADHDVAYSDALNITRPAMDSFFVRTLRPSRPK